MPIYVTYPPSTITKSLLSVSGQNLWVAGSTIINAEYGNGISYTPLTKGNSVSFQFAAGLSGVMDINILYAMSTADIGAVELKAEYSLVINNSSPTISLIERDPFSFTPGNDTATHVLSNAQSSKLRLNVVAESIVYCKITRSSTGNDTHPGTFNILDMRIRPD